MWKFILKIMALSLILAFIMLIVGYWLVATIYHIKVNFTTGEVYKVLREDDKVRIYQYSDRIEIYEYIQPSFSKAKWLWINAHVKDKQVHYLIDNNGRVWRVGRNHKPIAYWHKTIIPLKQKLTMLELIRKQQYTSSLAIPLDDPPYQCVYAQFAGSKIPLFVNGGMISGIRGTEYSFYLGLNKYYEETVYGIEATYNITTKDIALNETAQVVITWAPDKGSNCELPHGYNTLSINVDLGNWDFNTSLGGAIVVNHNLPDQAGNYTWLLYEKIPLLTDNSSNQIYWIYRVYYVEGAQISSGDVPPSNPVVRALWNGFNYLKKTFKTIGIAFVNALKQILPQQFKELLAKVWDVFNTVYNIFTRGLEVFTNLSDYFKLFVLLIPLIATIVAIYNPLYIQDFIMDLVDYLRKIVSFIRSLLPI